MPEYSFDWSQYGGSNLDKNQTSAASQSSFDNVLDKSNAGVDLISKIVDIFRPTPKPVVTNVYQNDTNPNNTTTYLSIGIIVILFLIIILKK